MVIPIASEVERKKYQIITRLEAIHAQFRLYSLKVLGTGMEVKSNTMLQAINGTQIQ